MYTMEFIFDYLGIYQAAVSLLGKYLINPNDNTYIHLPTNFRYKYCLNDWGRYRASFDEEYKENSIQFLGVTVASTDNLGQIKQ